MQRGTPMELKLIALPWSAYERPAAALGVLKAYVRAHRPAVDVEYICAYLPSTRSW
ncbi:hypothetical protein [Paraliomyxa miuraensis]|uniref:hypothetical protein n=1 Tax=Paraliomyxa miuraensis TaxID=376150 RepID=UPI0022563626|nr:hypothetical protein [Paraliomyxa miuraensis]